MRSFLVNTQRPRKGETKNNNDAENEWAVSKHFSRSMTFPYVKSSLTLTVNKFRRRIKGKKDNRKIKLRHWFFFFFFFFISPFFFSFFLSWFVCPNNCLSERRLNRFLVLLLMWMVQYIYFLSVHLSVAFSFDRLALFFSHNILAAAKHTFMNWNLKFSN